MGKLYRDLVRQHSKAKGSARAVLNILADYATDDGLAWPGRETLAQDTGLSERTVTRCLQTLCDQGRLTLEENARGGRGRMPHYKICFPELVMGDNVTPNKETDCHPLDAKRVTNGHIKGDNVTVKGDKSAQIQSYARSEPQLEPKLEPKKDDGDERARAHGAVFTAWAENIPGTMTPILSDKLHDLIDECGPPSVIYGITASVEAAVRNFKYIAACARNHAAGREPPSKPQARVSSNGTSKVAGNLAALDQYEEIKFRHGVTT